MIGLPPSYPVTNGICTDDVEAVIEAITTDDDMLLEETVCPTDTVYVPVEPAVPVNWAVIVVYCVTSTPEITCPTANAPVTIAETVKTFVAIEAVNVAELAKLGEFGLVAAGVPGH